MDMKLTILKEACMIKDVACMVGRMFMATIGFIIGIPVFIVAVLINVVRITLNGQPAMIISFIQDMKNIWVVIGCFYGRYIYYGTDDEFVQEYVKVAFKKD